MAARRTWGWEKSPNPLKPSVNSPALIRPEISAVVISTPTGSINQLSPHKSRVASYILTLDSQEEILKDLKDIPLFLGIGYRHFLRILSSFVEEGMLEKTEQGYRAADFSRLKKLAKDRYLI